MFEKFLRLPLKLDSKINSARNSEKPITFREKRFNNHKLSLMPRDSSKESAKMQIIWLSQMVDI